MMLRVECKGAGQARMWEEAVVLGGFWRFFEGILSP